MFTKLLIANRGEIASRIIRTARAMDIATVAVYSDADRHAPYVEQADESVHLPGTAPADTYLRADLILAAAKFAEPLAKDFAAEIDARRCDGISAPNWFCILSKLQNM